MGKSRHKSGGVRARYLTKLERIERLYDGPKFGHPFAAQITALKAGKPVIVPHGYKIDLPPGLGTVLPRTRRTITAVEPVLPRPGRPFAHGDRPSPPRRHAGGRTALLNGPTVARLPRS
jgi:hypothetical protein